MTPRVECVCVNVGMGSYEHQVEMRMPNGQQVRIDVCIATMLAWLWGQGVDTLNSCCGHQKIHESLPLAPSVIVSSSSVDQMHELGFALDTSGSAHPDQTFSLLTCSCDIHNGGWVGSDYLDADWGWDPECQLHLEDPNDD